MPLTSCKPFAAAGLEGRAGAALASMPPMAGAVPNDGTDACAHSSTLGSLGIPSQVAPICAAASGLASAHARMAASACGLKPLSKIALRRAAPVATAGLDGLG